MKLVIFVSGTRRRDFIEKKLEANGFTVKVKFIVRTDFAVETTVDGIVEATKVAELVGLDPDRFELTYHETWQ